MKPTRSYRQLQQIITGLTEGIILLDADGKIQWANEAALAMHGVRRIKDLGSKPSEYRRRYKLKYRNNRPVESAKYPVERTVAGETLRRADVADAARRA